MFKALRSTSEFCGSGRAAAATAPSSSTVRNNTDETLARFSDEFPRWACHRTSTGIQKQHYVKVALFVLMVYATIINARTCVWISFSSSFSLFTFLSSPRTLQMDSSLKVRNHPEDAAARCHPTENGGVGSGARVAIEEDQPDATMAAAASALSRASAASEEGHRVQLERQGAIGSLLHYVVTANREANSLYDALFQVLVNCGCEWRTWRQQRDPLNREFRAAYYATASALVQGLLDIAPIHGNKSNFHDRIQDEHTKAVYDAHQTRAKVISGAFSVLGMRFLRRHRRSCNNELCDCRKENKPRKKGQRFEGAAEASAGGSRSRRDIQRQAPVGEAFNERGPRANLEVKTSSWSSTRIMQRQAPVGEAFNERGPRANLEGEFE